MAEFRGNNRRRPESDLGGSVDLLIGGLPCTIDGNNKYDSFQTKVKPCLRQYAIPHTEICKDKSTHPPTPKGHTPQSHSCKNSK